MSDSERFYNEKPQSIRKVDRYIDISGTDEFGHPKAHMSIAFVERYADGSSDIIQEVSVPLKPIVSIFAHDGFVNVDLDFRSSRDADLAMVWNLLEEYKQPINSVDWLPEELESGIYIDQDGNERSLYFPMLELVLSPKNKETEYAIAGFNPLFFTLQPNDPKGEPCVIQFTFEESLFLVIEGLRDSVDLNEIRDEIMLDLAAEMLEDSSSDSESDEI